MPSLDLPHYLHNGVETWDRFIRNRKEVQHRFIDVPNDNVPASKDAIINQRLYSKSEETYKQMVASTLSINFRPQSWVPQWPVRTRCNPHLHSAGPRVVLDLPNIGQTINGNNTVDWSSTGFLTVAFPRCVYLWHSTTFQTLRVTSRNTTCLKWNPEGTTLFYASTNGVFKFSEVGATEEGEPNRCASHTDCFITCCAFHPSSPLVYTGCSMGSVCTYHTSKGLHIVTKIHEGNNQDAGVSALKLSIDGRYLAMAVRMFQFVFVYDTMNYAFLCTINTTAPSRALAWHPWKRSLLVVSDINGVLTLYNMLEPEKPEASYSPMLDSSIINLTFNPHSAELVVSQSVFISREDVNVRNLHGRRTTVQLNVLSSFDRVVDRLEGHTGSVQFLSWNPDGTQLATAGNDETARIWDFLPPSIKQRTTKNVPYKLNSVSASMEMGERMGLAIR